MASKDTAQASFSFDTVAVLVAALYDKGVSIGMKEYKRMAELDGSRGAFGFQHAFRKVTARAKELSSTGPGEGTPEKPNKGGGKKDKTNGEKTPKRSRKSAKSVSEDPEESPSKKLKPEPIEEEADGDEQGDDST